MFAYAIMHSDTERESSIWHVHMESVMDRFFASGAARQVRIMGANVPRFRLA
jgi:hypothetical protein